MSAGLDELEVEDAARRFVVARRSGTPLIAYPGPVPATLADAYRIQDAAIRGFAQPVAGWKIGRILPPRDAEFGCDRLAGPIFAASVRRDGSTAAMPVFGGGFAAVEAEFVFRLGHVDPARRSFTTEQAARCVEAVHVGIEIASSPLTLINALGPAVTVSDFGNNNGLIVGPEIAGWRHAAIDDWTVSIEIDGVVAGSGMARAFAGGTLRSVAFLLELLSQRGIAVPPGTWVSSGAVSGVHEVRPGARAIARFNGRFELACSFVAHEAAA